MGLITIQSGMSNPEQLSQLLVGITNRSEEIQAVGISISTTLIESLTDSAIENVEVINFTYMYQHYIPILTMILLYCIGQRKLFDKY